MPSLLPVNSSQCPFVQMTDTDVAFLLYYRSCPYNRHDLYLPSIPASPSIKGSSSSSTLGRFECAVANAPAHHGLRIARIISPLTLTLVFSEPSGRLQKTGPEFFLPSSHRRFDLCLCAPIFSRTRHRSADGNPPCAGTTTSRRRQCRDRSATWHRRRARSLGARLCRNGT